MKKFNIDCTGDCVVGDIVEFGRAVFEGRYPRAKFSYTEIIEAKIIRDSYGKAKQQHTFTLQYLDNNETFRIKGRNLYRNGTRRQEWDDESKRQMAINEKHNRGNIAREDRRVRKLEYDNQFEIN